MTDFDLKLCDVQGRLFVLSVTQGYGSNKFVKMFIPTVDNNKEDNNQ